MFGLRLDPARAIQILIFAAVFAACQAVYGLMRHGGAKRAVNARLKLAEAGMALSDIVGELRKQRGMGQDGRHKMSWVAWLPHSTTWPSNSSRRSGASAPWRLVGAS